MHLDNLNSTFKKFIIFREKNREEMLTRNNTGVKFKCVKISGKKPESSNLLTKIPVGKSHFKKKIFAYYYQS